MCIVINTLELILLFRYTSTRTQDTNTLDYATKTCTTTPRTNSPCYSSVIISCDRVLDLLVDSLQFFLSTCPPKQRERMKEHWLRTKSTNTRWQSIQLITHVHEGGRVRTGRWKQHWNKTSRLSCVNSRNRLCSTRSWSICTNPNVNMIVMILFTQVVVYVSTWYDRSTFSLYM